MEIFDDEVIRPLSNPLVDQGGLAVLRGNLAPNGAILKPSAATPALAWPEGWTVWPERRYGDTRIEAASC